MDVPRRSFAASLSPLRLIDGLPRRRSFNYNQMPEEPIKLTVLKLDGSSFGTYTHLLLVFTIKFYMSTKCCGSKELKVVALQRILVFFFCCLC